jgi:hypothetical protein
LQKLVRQVEPLAGGGGFLVEVVTDALHLAGEFDQVEHGVEGKVPGYYFVIVIISLLWLEGASRRR